MYSKGNSTNFTHQNGEYYRTQSVSAFSQKTYKLGALSFKDMGLNQAGSVLYTVASWE